MAKGSLSCAAALHGEYFACGPQARTLAVAGVILCLRRLLCMAHTLHPGYKRGRLRQRAFLTRYPSVPKGRIILSGTGYLENVTGVGADSRFTSCLLALHNYAYWATRTTAGWEADWRSRMGTYKNRTVVTEYGATMTTGKNYNGSQADNEVAYIVGSCNVFRNDGVASVYWPGLRDNDTYSIQTRGGSGTSITMTTTNASGVSRIRYGWGL